MRNPCFSSRALRSAGAVADDSRTMTIDGTIQKLAVLLAFVGAGAYGAFQVHVANAGGCILAALLAGFVLSMLIIFIPKTAPLLAWAYALSEGVVLGGLTAMMNHRYPGIGLTCVLLTFAVLAGMMGLYVTGLVRASGTLRRVLMGSMMGILILYLASFIGQMAGFTIPLLHSSGPFGIGLSLLITGIAAFNLVLDFDFAEQGARMRAPAYMEWYAAFGIIVTLVWLYLEILRLVGKLRSR